MKTLKIGLALLMIVALVAPAGCTIVDMKLDVSAAGVEAHFEVAEFGTSVEVELPELPKFGEDE